MIEQLAQHLSDPEEKLRAIVLNANGGKVFCSGHDLKEMVSSIITLNSPFVNISTSVC